MAMPMLAHSKTKSRSMEGGGGGAHSWVGLSRLYSIAHWLRYRLHGSAMEPIGSARIPSYGSAPLRCGAFPDLQA